MTASVRDSGCEDLEANQTDGRRLTPEGTRTRVATRTSSVSVRAKGCESRRAEHEYRRTLRAGHGPQRRDWLAGHVRFELRNVVANYPFEKSRRFAGNQPNSGHGDHSRLSCGVTETTNGCGLPSSAPKLPNRSSLYLDCETDRTACWRNSIGSRSPCCASSMIFLARASATGPLRSTRNVPNASSNARTKTESLKL
jgi:hypothetical protein